MNEKLKELKYIIFHPANGFEDLKQRKTGSVGLSVLLVLLWFFLTVIQRQYTNFRFNRYDVSNTNVFYIFISTIVLFVFLVLSNWATSTLSDGEGTFRQIWIFSAYSLLPICLFLLLNTIVSYVFSLDEAMFVTLFTYMGYAWAFLIFFNGIMQVHDYNFKQTIFSVLATVCGIVVLLFISFLVIMLFAQLFSFIGTIYEEIAFRKYN